MRPWLLPLVSALLSMPLAAAEPTLAGSRQCLLVLAPQWISTGGTMRLLERSSPAAPWAIVRGPFPVLLGRSGLAQGLGVSGLDTPAGLQKREGDGRSPAGLFALGTAFGFAPNPTRMPYLLVTPGTVAVDDVRSRFYTRIVDGATTRDPDWHSAEKMHHIPYYRLGLAVEYNTAHPLAGAGSCIFLHCFASPPKTTSGCTAMAEPEMATLLAWLDPAALPRLVQLPRAAYEKVRTAWHLPQIQRAGRRRMPAPAASFRL